jgi:hypothetical protein
MEGIEEGIMEGRTQNSRAAGPIPANTRRARLIAATGEGVADGGVACLGRTRRVRRPA